MHNGHENNPAAYISACVRANVLHMKYIFDKCFYGCIHNHQPSTSQKHNIIVQFFWVFFCFFLQHLSYCNIALFVIDKQELIIHSPQTDLNSDLRKVFTLCLV